jgi:hypothetical protein
MGLPDEFKHLRAVAVTVNTKYVTNLSLGYELAQLTFPGAITGNVPDYFFSDVLFQSAADLNEIENALVYLQPAGKEDMKPVAIMYHRQRDGVEGSPTVAGTKAVHRLQPLPSNQLQLAADVFRNAQHPQGPFAKQTTVTEVENPLFEIKRLEFGPEGAVNGRYKGQFLRCEPAKSEEMAGTFGCDQRVSPLSFSSQYQSSCVGELLPVVTETLCHGAFGPVLDHELVGFQSIDSRIGGDGHTLDAQFPADLKELARIRDSDLVRVIYA